MKKYTTAFFTLALLLLFTGLNTNVVSQSLDMVTTTAISQDLGSDDSQSSKKGIKGRVASLNAIVTGQEGYVDKAKALKLYKKAQPLVLKAENGDIYFVYYADGFYAGKELARNADKGLIKVTGRVKTKHGIKIIIYNEIIG